MGALLQLWTSWGPPAPQPHFLAGVYFSNSWECLALASCTDPVPAVAMESRTQFHTQSLCSPDWLQSRKDAVGSLGGMCSLWMGCAGPGWDVLSLDGIFSSGLGCAQERGQLGSARADEGLGSPLACSRWVRTVPVTQDGFLELRIPEAPPAAIFSLRHEH